MKKWMIISIIILVIAVGIFFFTGSNKNTNNNQTSVSEKITGNNIAIKDFAFSPRILTINIGDEVIWTNEDSAPHVILSDSGNEISSPSLTDGQKYTHKFSNAGTYTYHCSIHPSMKGEVVVK